mmetsp:Transcript_9590/g.14436  ORF Transcript_9590/g.14436 Transcript_9590/m.14436 type:complete len:212 (-) Transcript_9590:418-1053(-)
MDCELELYSAVYDGDLELVKRLLENGESANSAVANSGMNLCHLAVFHQYPDILSLLIQYGADVNDCNDGVSTVLQVAIDSYTTNPDVSLKLTEILTKHVKNRNVLGQALQVASGMGFIPIVRLLLNAGADPNYFPSDDEFEMTPLVGMIFENEMMPDHLEIAKLLVEAGADINHVSAGKTLIDYATEYGRNDLLPFLEEKGQMETVDNQNS